MSRLIKRAPGSDDSPSVSPGRLSPERGYSLIELVVVVGVVSILTAIALPSIRPYEAEKLELAAVQVVEALRFARAEAIRSGNPVYVEIAMATDRLLIAEADLTGPTVAPGQTLRDPVSTQLFDTVLSSSRTTSGVDVMNDPFDYASGGRQASVVFDAEGVPFRKASGTNLRMTGGDVQLALGAAEATIFLDSITGRVWR